MQIRDFLREVSFENYPKKAACVVFTPGCNYRCPACHAKYLLEDGKNIDEKEFFDYLDNTNKEKRLIDGVVICGGEPTLQLGLIEFAEKIKRRGIDVKLDTNGSDYAALLELKGRKIIDYVAMDIKASPSLYKKTTGKEHVDLKDYVEKGMVITAQFPDYEFRTTIVPVDRGNEKIGFLNADEVIEIAKWIIRLTGSNEHKYFLQAFVPRKLELIDSQFEKFSETPANTLQEIKRKVSKYLPKCSIRQ